MLYFFTFCVDIKRHSKNDMARCLQLMVNSIHKHNKDYKIICFRNFDINKYTDLSNYNIEFRNYYDRSTNRLYNDKWLNLSFNKINLYKDLYDETNIDYIWIDLDTIITTNISYLNDYDHFFIENGGNSTNKSYFFNNSNINIPRNIYIQGNFWKLNIDLYHKLMNVFYQLQQKKLILKYDLQTLYGYYIYILNSERIDNFNILGNTVKKETINGLCVWSKEGNTHATIDGLSNMYNDNGILKTNFYPNKEIHILSFTFYTLRRLWNTKKFIILNMM